MAETDRRRPPEEGFVFAENVRRGRWRKEAEEDGVEEEAEEEEEEEEGVVEEEEEEEEEEGEGNLDDAEEGWRVAG